MRYLDWTNLSSFIFLFALFLGFVIYVIVSKYRGNVYTVFLRKFNLHHLSIGILIGYSCMQTSLGELFTKCVSLSALILVGWFSVMVGITLDMRRIRYFDLRRAITEFVVFLVLMLLVFVIQSFISEDLSIPFWVLVSIFSTAALCWPPQQISDRHVRIVRPDWWMPSGTMMLGIVALGFAGFKQKDLIPIAIAQPFSAPVIFHSIGEFAILSIVMGCVLGLLLDLVTRGLSLRYMAYVVCSVLMILVGIGFAVGLDSIWICFVGGIWFINTTIERKQVLKVFGRGDQMLNRCIFFVFGLIIGSQLALGDINFKMGSWFFLILMLQIIIRLFFLERKNYARKIRIDSAVFDLSIFGSVGFFSMFLTGNHGATAGILMAWIIVRLIWLNGGVTLLMLSNSLASSDTGQES